MIDPIFRDWLEQQQEQGMALAAETDLMQLDAVDDPRARYDSVPQAFIAKFFCKGLVQKAGGEIGVAEEFHVGIWFPSDHLRKARPQELVTWLHPAGVWHPNIRPPFVCVGHVCAGAELVNLLYECFEMITYQNFATHDSLNDAAAEWARNHSGQLPVDRRPLKWRKAMEVDQTPSEVGVP